MAKITEGSPEWFRVRQRIAADYIRALDAIEAAGASVERNVHEWQALDDVLKGALYHSAVIHYTRPFTYKPNYGGNKLKHYVGFDLELHGHLINLRNSLVAHHDNDVLRAWVGHQYYDLALSGAHYTAMIATCAVAKALHTIQTKSVAERYASHITACATFFRSVVEDELSAIHKMALRFPAGGAGSHRIIRQSSWARPRTTPFKVERIRAALDEGRGVRETAKFLKISAAKVSEVRRMLALRPARRGSVSDDQALMLRWLIPLS